MPSKFIKRNATPLPGGRENCVERVAKPVQEKTMAEIEAYEKKRLAETLALYPFKPTK